MRQPSHIIIAIMAITLITVSSAWAFMTRGSAAESAIMVLPTVAQLSSLETDSALPGATDVPAGAVQDALTTSLDASDEPVISEIVSDTTAAPPAVIAQASAGSAVAVVAPANESSSAQADDLTSAPRQATATPQGLFSLFSFEIALPATETTLACDVGQLYDAIYNQPAVTIINLAPGCTYTLDDPNTVPDSPNNTGPTTFSIYRSLTIDGQGATIERTSPVAYRFFYAGAGITFTLKDVTLIGGDSRTRDAQDNVTGGDGGAIFAEGSTVTLEQVTIRDSRGFLGGAIMNRGNAFMTIIDSTLIDNASDGSGGGIYNQGSSTTLILDNTVIDDNAAGGSGGGIYNADRATLFANNNTIIGDDMTGDAGGNTAAGDGGGIYNLENGQITLNTASISHNQAVKGGGVYNIGGGDIAANNASLIAHNTATDDGGGVYNIGDGTTFTLNGSTLSYNIAQGDPMLDDGSGNGGGIYNLGNASADIRGTSVIADNTADKGGGIFTEGIHTTLQITQGSFVQRNQALSDQDAGAGILGRGGVDLHLLDAIIENNDATQGWGGGLFIGDGDTTATLQNTLIKGNTAVNGAGIYHRAGTVTITNGTIQDNIAEDTSGDNSLGNGGGLYNTGNSAQLTIASVVITGNQARQGDGAGLYNSGAGTVTINGGGFGAVVAQGITTAANVAEGSGGGIFNSDANSSVTITNVDFEGNRAYRGGGIANVSEGRVELSNVGLNGNIVLDDPDVNVDAGVGGGLYNSDTGTVMIADATTITGSEALRGGGVANLSGASFALTSGTIGGETLPERNSATDEGGGVLNDSATATMTLTQVVIRNNTTNDLGGGVSNKGGTFTAERVLIADNAARVGGGIYSAEGQITLTNATVSSNTSTENGFGAAGITLFSNADTAGAGGQLTLTHVTIAANTAPNGSTASGIALEKGIEAFDTFYSNIQMAATIIETGVGTACGAGAAGGAAPTLVSNGHNLASDGTCAFLDAPTDTLNAALLLDPLADLGGGLDGHLPDGDSDAAGNIPTGQCTLAPRDQRGVSRPQGLACESGAIEFVEYSVYQSTPRPGTTLRLNTAFGTTASVDVTITKTGTADLVISDLTLVGDPAITVMSDSPTPHAIQDEETDSLIVTLTCSGDEAGAAYQSILYVTHDSPVAPNSPTLYPIECAVGGIPQTPVAQTVGVVQANRWVVSTTDQLQVDAQYNFGFTHAAAQPLVGDWNGDGVQTAGSYYNGVAILRLLNGEAGTDIDFRVGPTEPGWTALAADWDGDGVDSIGLYQDGLFLFSNDNTTGRIEKQLRYGLAGSAAQPIAGDWDGDFVDTVGLYENGLFMLADVRGHTTHNFAFGSADWAATAIAGDWNADGIDTVGLYFGGIWRLRDTNTTGLADRGFNFGPTTGGWSPVIGYFDDGVSPPSRLFGLGASLEPHSEATAPVEITPEATPLVELTAESTAAPDLTPEQIPETESTPDIASTSEATPMLEPEMTATAAPEITPEASPTEPAPEATAEATALPTSETTPEATEPS